MKQKINLFILMIVTALMVTVCYLTKVMMEYKSGRDAYCRIRDAAVTDASSPIERKVDFTVTESLGCSAVSWIYIPGTNIDYPLVQGSDNGTYLERDAYGNKSKAGAIFLNCENDLCLGDAKSIIFGHNMKDGSMFHDLMNYRDESYAKNHQKLYIYHDNGVTMQYDLIYTLSTVWQDSIYTVSSMDTAEDIVRDLASRADAAYGDAGRGNLVILSTCIKKDQRYLCVFQEAEVIKQDGGNHSSRTGANISLGRKVHKSD